MSKPTMSGHDTRTPDEMRYYAEREYSSILRDRVARLESEVERLKAENDSLTEMLLKVREAMTAIGDYGRDPSPANEINLLKLNLEMAAQTHRLKSGATPA